MAPTSPSYFHLHLVSDATGETLTTIAKAAAVQYAQVRPIEHMHPLVRTPRQLKRVLQEIEQTPGIVLYTLVNKDLCAELEKRCKELKSPCLAVLQPIMQTFESYLGAPQTPTVAGQHVLDADYFKRIDAMNFTMAHDDGRLPDNLSDADIILLGISRTSKTPTSIYLAQRGYKTANLPIVPSLPMPESLTEPRDSAQQRLKTAIVFAPNFLLHPEAAQFANDVASRGLKSIVRLRPEQLETFSELIATLTYRETDFEVIVSGKDDCAGGSFLQIDLRF